MVEVRTFWKEMTPSRVLPVQLCGCHLVGGEAVLQRVEGDVGQVQRLIEGLAHKHVQALPGNLLHNEAQEHVIHIGVHRLVPGS